MIARYIIAVIGALAVTIGLLLFMSDMTARYVMRDPIRYFQIMDVFKGPERRPERVRPPTDPRLAPDVPELEFDPLQERRTAPGPQDGVDIDPQIIREPVVPESA